MRRLNSTEINFDTFTKEAYDVAEEIADEYLGKERKDSTLKRVKKISIGLPKPYDEEVITSEQAIKEQRYKDRNFGKIKMQNGKSGSKFLKKKKVFWKNKKVVITGCTGFKGSWLSFILKRYGAKIYGIALKPQNKNDIFTKSNLLKEIKFYECDINDSKKLKNLFKKIKPDITFHLAAQSLVLVGYQKKEETYKTNIIGSSNVIEACRNLKKKTTLLITTTDKVYKNYNKKKYFKENDTIGGNDPYSVSKAALEVLCDYYLDLSKKDKFFSLSVARSGNVIGGGDWSANRLFPDIINALKKNKEIVVRSPNSTRPWQHVLDPLYGYLNLVEKNFKNKKYCKAYNFGPKNNSSEILNINSFMVAYS